MNSSLRLADAQRRLGKPGRPRKAAVQSSAPPSPLSPRLIDVEGAAAYLGLSPWTLRALVAAGTLTRVRIPMNGSEIRRILLDREDLDRLISRWKDGPA